MAFSYACGWCTCHKPRIVYPLSLVSTPLPLPFISNLPPPFIHLPLLLQQVQGQFLYIRQQFGVQFPKSSVALRPTRTPSARMPPVP